MLREPSSERDISDIVLIVDDIPAADADGKTTFALAVPADATLGENALVVSQVQHEDIAVEFTVIEEAVAPSPTEQPTAGAVAAAGRSAPGGGPARHGNQLF